MHKLIFHQFKVKRKGNTTNIFNFAVIILYLHKLFYVLVRYFSKHGGSMLK